MAVHLFLMRGPEVLLQRRFNTGYEDGKFSVVAGHIESGETMGRAMHREALEEIGIIVMPRDLRLNGILHRRSSDQRLEFFFTADLWQGDVANNEPDKCDRLQWSGLDALPTNTVAYIRHALQLSVATPEAAWPWFDESGWE